MNPFETYVSELSEYLPKRNRGDIAKEVASDLHAELDAMKASMPEKADELLMKLILKQRETPDELARHLTSLPAPSLIGANVYPLYRFSLLTALLVSISAIIAIAIGLDGLKSSLNWSLAGDVVLSAMIIFAVVTIVFAMVERSKTSVAVPDGQRIYGEIKGELSGGKSNFRQLTFYFEVLLTLGIFPQFVGFPLLTFSPSFHIYIFPILSASFFGLPRIIIIAWCLLSMLLVAAKMKLHDRLGQWKLDFTLRFLGVLVGFFVLTSDPVFAIPLSNNSHIPSDIFDVMSQVIAPKLYETLLATYWLSLLIKCYFLIQEAFKLKTHVARPGIKA